VALAVTEPAAPVRPTRAVAARAAAGSAARGEPGATRATTPIGAARTRTGAREAERREPRTDAAPEAGAATHGVPPSRARTGRRADRRGTSGDGGEAPLGADRRDRDRGRRCRRGPKRAARALSGVQPVEDHHGGGPDCCLPGRPRRVGGLLPGRDRPAGDLGVAVRDDPAVPARLVKFFVAFS
jgi:hypothetical protein